MRDVLNRVPLHVNRDDLASAAMYALASAARNFDPTLGVPFAGYAALRMRGALTDELRSMDWASRESRRRARGIESAATRLTEKLGRTPTSREVAEELGLKTVEMSTVRADAERASVLSLHSLAPDHEELDVPSRQDGPKTCCCAARNSDTCATRSPSCPSGCARWSRTTSSASARWPTSQPISG